MLLKPQKKIPRTHPSFLLDASLGINSHLFKRKQKQKQNGKMLNMWKCLWILDDKSVFVSLNKNLFSLPHLNVIYIFRHPLWTQILSEMHFYLNFRLWMKEVKTIRIDNRYENFYLTSFVLGIFFNYSNWLNFFLWVTKISQLFCLATKLTRKKIFFLRFTIKIFLHLLLRLPLYLFPIYRNIT